MITAEQESNLAAAHARAKKKQDKANPYVVNIHDGRLMPNTPRLRVHKDYRVLPMDQQKATSSSAAERLRWLEKAVGVGSPKVMNSMAESDAFDVGTANPDELAVFAMEQWGFSLDPRKPLKTLRAEVMKKASEMEAQAVTDLSA